MNEAAERYSPEIAEAFQPTETERPATKKSPAVLDVRADQKPIAIVAATVTKENAKTQPSNSTSEPKKFRVNMPGYGWRVMTRAASSRSMAMER